MNERFVNVGSRTGFDLDVNFKVRTSFLNRNTREISTSRSRRCRHFSLPPRKQDPHVDGLGIADDRNVGAIRLGLPSRPLDRFDQEIPEETGTRNFACHDERVWDLPDRTVVLGRYPTHRDGYCDWKSDPDPAVVDGRIGQ